MFEPPEDFDGRDIEFDDVYQDISDYADGEGGCASTVFMAVIGTSGLIYALSVTL